MEFLEIKIENFLSISSETLLLRDRGVLLITGENGAGKSSLTSKAICWGLFGQTLKGVKGDAVVNVTSATEPSSVEIRFLVGDKIHTVRRSRNPTSLELDGQRFRVPADTQRAIEQLVGRDVHSFMAADYFGQDRPIDFLSMTSSTQMETMEGILHLSRLDQVVAVAKEKASKERGNLEQVQGVWQSVRGQLSELNRQMTLANDRHAQFLLEIDRREHRRRGLDTTENELRRAILKGSVLHVMIDRTRLEEEIDSRLKLADKHQVEDAAYKAQAIHLQSEINSYRARLRDIQDEICPVCGGRVQPELTVRLREEQEKLREIYDRLLNRQLCTSQWLATSAQNRVDFADHIESLRHQLKNSNINIQKFEERLAELNKERAGLDLEDQRAHAVMNEIVGLIDMMTKQHEALEGVVAERDAVMKRSMNRLSMITYWIDVFGKTFKNMILEQALPFLEERTEYHLRLLNNPELKVSFSTQKTLKSGEERYQFTTVAYRDQGGQSELALSGGERQIVSFAVGLALSELADSQTGSPSNLMILDEPFTMLSTSNSEAVVHYVATELVKRKATILLISNDERMKALVPGGLHVRRGDDGKSRVA